MPHQRKLKVVEWNYFSLLYNGCESNKFSEGLVLDLKLSRKKNFSVSNWIFPFAVAV